MSKFEEDYKSLLHRVLYNGTRCKNRTGVDTIASFGEDLTIGFAQGFPVVTGKKIFFAKAYHEYTWIVVGGQTTEYLNKHGIHWWDGYAKDGKLAKTYGYQLLYYNGKENQVEYVINEILKGSRRAHITMWNPSDLEEQALPCCYTGMTFVRIGNTLNLNMDFRSSDLFLGLPYDIIFGGLFLKDIAEICQLNVGKLKLNLNNAHIYENHIEQVQTYLRSKTYTLPFYGFGDTLIDYKCGPYLDAKLNE
jgi:thymidylate synthase